MGNVERVVPTLSTFAAFGKDGKILAFDNTQGEAV